MIKDQVNQGVFSIFFVVTIQSVGNNGKLEPKITMRFPPSDPNVPDKLVNEAVPFCFPDIKETEKLFTEQVETFTFILTNADGSLRFGFCRRFLGEDPECHVLISGNASYSLFTQILSTLEDLQADIISCVTFLEELYKMEMPKPGENLMINVPDDEGDRFYTFVRADNAYEYLDYVSYGQLFSLVAIKDIEYLFEAMLMARRIVVVSSTLVVLSGCILAIKHMVYPLDWQHIFIPILPESLIDYLCAPMPFLIGILSSSIKLLDGLPIEEMVILDLDSGTFIQKPEWESYLPPTLTSTLKKSLKLILKNKGLYEGRDFSQSVAHAFLRFWVCIWSGYTNFLKKNEKFNFDEFVLTKSPEEQRLLQAIGKSRLCSVFYREQEMLKDTDKLSDCILTQAKFDHLGALIKESIPQRTTMQKISSRVGKKKNEKYEAVTRIGGRKVAIRNSILETNKNMEKALYNETIGSRMHTLPIVGEDDSPRLFKNRKEHKEFLGTRKKSSDVKSRDKIFKISHRDAKNVDKGSRTHTVPDEKSQYKQQQLQQQQTRYDSPIPERITTKTYHHVRNKHQPSPTNKPRSTTKTHDPSSTLQYSSLPSQSSVFSTQPLSASLPPEKLRPIKEKSETIESPKGDRNNPKNVLLSEIHLKFVKKEKT